jgi:acyl-coenzyme A synthetase/AMP-(fatty) acid ligase
LILMMEHGGLLERSCSPPLRAIIFAGEVFPIRHLRRLRHHYPHVRLWNWYGPTETNVCMSYEVNSLDAKRVHPVPIGRPCCGNTATMVSPVSAPVAADEQGELQVSGPTVMQGYWGKSPLAGDTYATGDIVRRDLNGDYVFVGRRDHMVKIRGYRVELGEVEAILALHSAVREVAVSVMGTGHTAKLVAFVVLHPGANLSLLGAKAHCASHLPRYMIIDRLHVKTALPLTDNGKIDRNRLVVSEEPSSGASFLPTGHHE